MSFPEFDLSKILNREMKSLSRRSRSVFETRERLLGRELPEDIIDEVIAQLLRYGFLNDQRYAREYFRSKLRSGYGVLRIRRELKGRGVDSCHIREAIEDEDNDISELDVFRDVLEKRIRSKGEPSNQKELKNLSDFLMRRGFPSEVVRKHLEPYFHRVFKS